MKILSHTLIRNAQFSDLQQLVKKQQSEIASATRFVKEIEHGNLDATLDSEHGADQDVLASSLTSMRDQMKQFANEEKQRNWVTQGLAQFVDILRSKNDHLAELTDNIIRNLIKYLNANQGALYILKDNNPKEVYLEMAACYAYNRKKHLNNRIELGQGMAGQVVLEKSTLYMTDVPNDFMRITSGLGEALPRNLVIVPLKIDQTVFGVIEIASFEKILPHQIEFVEKLGESIASTISSVKISERTRQLLGESQQRAEEMRAQEEEMRQNMEELAATQEEMHRVLKEVQENEAYVNEILNASKDSIFTVDRDIKLISWNKAFSSGLEAMGFQIEKGFEILSIFSYDKKKEEQQRSYYLRALAGENLDVTEELNVGGSIAHYATNYSPLRTVTGEVFAAAIYGRDVTMLATALNESKRLATEAQQQAEEVKAQEEELRQNMEELSATQEEMQRVLNEVQAKERYMIDMINSTKDTIISVDRNYCVVHFNEAMSASYSGMGIKIVKGFDLSKIFSEEEWPKFKAHYDRALQGESFEVIEEYHSHGFDSYFVITYSPLRNEKNEIIAAAVFAKDTTQTVKAQKEAENLQRYYHDVIEGMSDCVVTIDRNYTIVVANSAFKHVFSKYGLPVEPGSSLLAMAKGNKKAEEKFKQPYIKAFAGEHVEEPHRHHFDRDFQVSYNPLKDAKGEIIGVSLIAHDITQRLQLLKESQQQTEELKAQEEELRQNMEEMQSIQENVTLKAEEVEKIRFAEMEKFKKTEQEYIVRIQKLELELVKSKKGSLA